MKRVCSRRPSSISARARLLWHGRRRYKMTAAKVRPAQAAMADQETNVGDLCRDLGVTRHALYRHVGPRGELRPDGRKLLARARTGAPRALSAGRVV